VTLVKSVKQTTDSGHVHSDLSILKVYLLGVIS